MDGAIILAGDASRIARANVHLVPNPNVPTSETGTRHRTAERVARSIDVPVISVSEDMAIIAVYVGDEKHPLEAIPRLLVRANQALQTLERYKHRLDEGHRARCRRWRSRTSSPCATWSTCCSAPRWCAASPTRSRADIVELGVDGRLVKPPARGADGRRRGRPPPGHARLLPRGVRLAPRRGAGRPVDHGHRGAARPQGGGRRAATCRATPVDLDANVSPAATGCWPGSPACPSRSSSASSTGSAPSRRSCGPPSTTSTTSPAWARPGPGPSRRACPAWPSPASSTATPEPAAALRRHAHHPAVRHARRDRPPPGATRPAPGGRPRHRGPAAAVRRPRRPPGRRERLGGVRLRAVAGPRRPAPTLEAGCAAAARSTTSGCWRDAGRRRRRHGVEPVGGRRVLHGRDVRPQGRRHRAVRPGGPRSTAWSGCPRCGRARPRASRSTRWPAAGRPGARDRRHGRPVAAARRPRRPRGGAASRSCATRAPTTASSTTQPPGPPPRRRRRRLAPAIAHLGPAGHCDRPRRTAPARRGRGARAARGR